jgi:succinate dehydrogenase hydrophobic anchor subunit
MMVADIDEKKSVAWVEKGLVRLPLISGYVQRRGSAYVISWLHRICGLLVAFFVGFHLLALQTLATPELFNAKMGFYSGPLPAFLEWALALPVMLHALNGGRLILFESFGYRRDDALLNWMTGLWALYCGLLGATMLAGGQPLSAGIFWLWTLAGSTALVYVGVRQIWSTAHALAWKLQRLSGLFLVLMVPAHLLFMHLNPVVAKDAATVLARMQNPFIKLVDFILVAAVLFHGAYGLFSIAADYIASAFLRRAIAALVAAIAFFFALLAIRLLFL